jgi:hypothetical protein
VLLDPAEGVASAERGSGLEEVEVKQEIGEQLALQRAVAAEQPVHDLQVGIAEGMAQ